MHHRLINLQSFRCIIILSNCNHSGASSFYQFAIIPVHHNFINLQSFNFFGWIAYIVSSISFHTRTDRIMVSTYIYTSTYLQMYSHYLDVVIDQSTSGSCQSKLVTGNLFAKTCKWEPPPPGGGSHLIILLLFCNFYTFNEAVCCCGDNLMS